MSIINKNTKFRSSARVYRVKQQAQSSTSPEMKKVREQYIPEDKFLEQPRSPARSDDPDVKVLNNGWKLSLSKEKPAPDDPSWEDTKVPGQWALHDSSLFNHGGNVWYMKRFRVTPDMVKDGKKLHLEFKGVDYQSEVYLNDKKLGEHEGYFTPFKFDISDKVKPGKLNVLQVKVTSEKDKGAPFFKSQVKGIFSQHDARPGGSGAPSNVGNTGGIWNDVLLRTTGMQTIENTNVNTELSDDHKKAKLEFGYTLYNHEEKATDVKIKVRYRLRGSDDPKDFKYIEKKIKLKPGFNQVSLKTVEKDPKLWWTWEHGKPNLYDYETAVVCNGEVSQKARSHFGIRKLEYDPKTHLLKLNDKKIFQRGTNYIPTQWLSTYSSSEYARDLKDMKKANLNAVRVHAHVLPHEFYSFADEMGMLVYSDFPLIWGVNPMPGVTAKAKKQYAELIKEYRKHPSIWLWNVHNEPLPYNYFQDKELYNMGKEMDPTRAHKKDSGFLDHFYPGWYDWYGKDYRNISWFKPELPTEYGAQAIPRSAKNFIPKKDQWPINEPIWKYHDMQPDIMRKKIGDYKAFKNLDEFIELSQKYQYDLNKYITEYFRRNKYKPTSGIYQFMFKEAWPSVTWAVADHNTKKKMAYQGLKESMAPTMVSIDWDKTTYKPGETFKAPLWVVNDLYDKVESSRLKWKIYEMGDKDKRPVALGSLNKDISPDSSCKWCTAHFKVPENAQAGKKWVLEVNLSDKNGKKLSQNDLVFGTPENRKDSLYKYKPVHVKYPAVG